MSAEFILVASAVGLGLVFLVAAVVNVTFYLRLKRYEPDTWNSLGSPMPLVNLGSSNFADVRRFLREGRHKKLRDACCANLGSLVRITDRVFLGYIAIAAIAVVYIVVFVRP